MGHKRNEYDKKRQATKYKKKTKKKGKMHEEDEDILLRLWEEQRSDKR